MRQTMFERKKLWITAIRLALIMTALVVMMTGTAGATALPVNPALPCATNGSGCLNGTSSVQVTANTCINFFSTNAPDTCDGNLVPASDNFTEVGPTDLLNFPALGTVGTIKDQLIPPFVGPPAGTTNFMHIGLVTFDLTSVIPSSLAACAGLAPSACSAGIFSLTQTSPSQVTVSFNFTANACTNGSVATGCTLAGGSTPYIIAFTSQLNNQTINGAIAQAATPAGITNSLSLTANPIPEPAAFLLVGAGLLAVVGISRRAKRHQSRV
jgi:hypothetical protein